MGQRFEFADDHQTRARSRELRRLFHIIEPDSGYHPFFVSDEASLLDCLGTDEADMLAALRQEFGPGFCLSLRQPVWQLVDQIRVSYLGWFDASEQPQ